MIFSPFLGFLDSPPHLAHYGSQLFIIIIILYDYDHYTHSTSSSIEAWIGWGTGIITSSTVFPTTLRATRTIIASSWNLHVYTKKIIIQIMMVQTSV